MQAITFKCEVITPMFLAGADGRVSELRPPSIKGAMRFWWRALNGHLPLDKLKKREGAIFGDTKNRSRFTVSIKALDIHRGTHKPVMHKGYSLPCILPKSTFEVTFRVPMKTKDWDIKKTGQLFELVTILGGLGKRVRRGMGSIDILSSDGDWNKQKPLISHIKGLLTAFSDYYIIKDDIIYNNFSGGMQYYPWIRQIEIGDHNSNILKDISDITHELHARYPRYKKDVYEASLGHASRGRFASPIYVSVVKGEKPIITSLNTIPDRNPRDISLRLQDEFRDKILNL